MTKLAAAGKLWEDEDFALIKMDPFCKEIKEWLWSKPFWTIDSFRLPDSLINKIVSRNVPSPPIVIRKSGF